MIMHILMYEVTLINVLAHCSAIHLLKTPSQCSSNTHALQHTTTHGNVLLCVMVCMPKLMQIFVLDILMHCQVPHVTHKKKVLRNAPGCQGNRP